MKSFRQASRKLLKSLAREIDDFAVSCDFKGLRHVLLRAPSSTSAVSALAPGVENKFELPESATSTNSVEKKDQSPKTHERAQAEICRICAGSRRSS
jgi:hypothetical protein